MTQTKAAQNTANTIDRTSVDVARVTIELQSPAHIGTGRGNDLVDQFFVTDTNDLPAIPGSSIAGVLRSLWTGLQDPLMTEQEIFGHQAEGENSHEHSWASRLVVSWGHLHNSHDRPVPFRMAPTEIDKDALLRQARIPATRQHVRINHRGVATHHGLFDEAIIHAGHRFTFELALHGCPTSMMDTLLHLLNSDACRFGGKTRRGLGRFRIVRCFRRHFNLRTPKDFADYAKLPTALELSVSEQILPKFQFKSTPLQSNTVTATLDLKPRGFWLIGGGSSVDTDQFIDPDRTPDILPYRESRVIWNTTPQSDRATLDPQHPSVVIPASSIKGALRHRARFHAFAIQETFADTVDLPFWKSLQENKLPEPLLEELFGTVRPQSPSECEDADTSDVTETSSYKQLAGRLVLDDIVVDEKQLTAKEMEHVSLDRFTQGPLQGHLFQEFAYWKNKQALHLEIHIRNANTVTSEARQVLLRTLEDLIQGHLQIGAGSGRGHGWFEGKLVWSDPSWINTAPESQTSAA